MVESGCIYIFPNIKGYRVISRCGSGGWVLVLCLEVDFCLKSGGVVVWFCDWSEKIKNLANILKSERDREKSKPI